MHPHPASLRDRPQPPSSHQTNLITDFMIDVAAGIAAALCGRFGRWRRLVAIASASTALISAGLIIAIAGNAVAPVLLAAP